MLDEQKTRTRRTNGLAVCAWAGLIFGLTRADGPSLAIPIRISVLPHLSLKGMISSWDVTRRGQPPDMGFRRLALSHQKRQSINSIYQSDRPLGEQNSTQLPWLGCVMHHRSALAAQHNSPSPRNRIMCRTSPSPSPSPSHLTLTPELDSHSHPHTLGQQATPWSSSNTPALATGDSSKDN